MKKIFIIALVFLMAIPATSFAQMKLLRVGVKAGLGFTNMTNLEELRERDFLKTYTGFNAGLVLNINLPLGFELQPELLYIQSGFKVNSGLIGDIIGGREDLSIIKSGSLRVPVNIQWGFSFLGIFKPYIVASPYVGCALFQNGKFLGHELSVDDIQRFQYGIGLGAGINIWKFQLSFKWNWDLNPMVKTDDITIEEVRDQLNSAKMNGGELSLAFIF